MVGLWSRGKHWLLLKLGYRATSRYDESWEDDWVLLENTGAGSELLVRSLREQASAYWLPDLRNGAPVYTVNGIADAASSLAEIAVAFPYAAVLLHVVRVERALALEQALYGRQVDVIYANPINDWLTNRDLPFRAAKKEMLRRRLDMDAAAWDARPHKDDPAHPDSIKAEAARRTHSAAMDKVQTFLTPLREDHAHHLTLLHNLLLLQRSLHTTSANLLKGALEKMGHAPSSDVDFNASNS